jgi:hypothetical protein
MNLYLCVIKYMYTDNLSLEVCIVTASSRLRRKIVAPLVCVMAPLS